MIKFFAAGFFACYLLAGSMIGMGLKYGVPATNYYGVAYISCIWPWWLATPWIGYEPPVPSWSFTFSERSSIGSEHQPSKLTVAGSNPAARAKAHP